MALHYEDVTVGFRFETGTRTITADDLTRFAELSGDFNPLHVDAAFGVRSIYGRPIAHGALVLSLATGLRQQTGLFDGTLMGLLEIRCWRFLQAVGVGDTIRVVSEVTELRETSQPDRGVITQRIEVWNQRDELVNEGELVALLRRRDLGLMRTMRR